MTLTKEQNTEAQEDEIPEDTLANKDEDTGDTC